MLLNVSKIGEFKVELYKCDGDPVLMVTPQSGKTIVMTGKHATEMQRIIQDIIDVISDKNKKES